MGWSLKRAGRARTAFFIILLAALGGALFAETAPPKATVSLLEGQAQARQGATGDWKPVAQGDAFSAEWVVRTEKGSRLELKLPDGSVLRVAPDSRIQLKSLLATGEKDKPGMSFKVEAGKIWANVSKALGSDRKFEVATDSAVAGVRGTVFRVDVLEDAATIVRVYAGAVAVTNAPIFERKPEPKGDRVQVPGPREVTKKEFEELVAKAMQEVRVSADGKLTMSAFTAGDQDDWVRWNQTRDGQPPKGE
ncbi:MAG: hypothetical protein C4523_07055 [Myxococcales bacterium]|nr:MAG: hypothetical protein C4523_07055 [Myxococcales bacterium]